MKKKKQQKKSGDPYECFCYLTRDEYEKSDWSEVYDFDEFCDRALERALDGKPDARLSYL